MPSCGFDSIPSDISAYLSNKTLKSLPTPLEAGSSMTAHQVKGGISGGTVSSAMTMFESIPRKDLKDAGRDYAISPSTFTQLHLSLCIYNWTLVAGRRPPRTPLYYKVPIPGARPLIGAYFFMEPANKALVQRTFGLLELEAQTSKSKEAQLARYGPDFVYDEFLTMPNAFAAVSFTFVFMTGFLLVAFVQPVHTFFQVTVPS